MIKFYLVSGEVKFLTHKVEWATIRKERLEDGSLQEVEGKEERNFFDTEKLNQLTKSLDERKIEYTITEYEQPDEAILERCKGLKFDTMDEALKAYGNGFMLPNISPEQMRADVDYIAIMTGVEL